jgi:hypothetical protein
LNPLAERLPIARRCSASSRFPEHRMARIPSGEGIEAEGKIPFSSEAGSSALDGPGND